MKPPTEAQQGVLDAIRTLTQEKGFPPSVREIGAAVGLSSASTVHAHLSCLLRDGHIRRDPHSPRALVLVDDPVRRLIEGAERMATYEDAGGDGWWSGWGQVKAALRDLGSDALNEVPA